MAGTGRKPQIGQIQIASVERTAAALIVAAISIGIIWAVATIRDNEWLSIEAERAQKAADAERERNKDDAIVRDLSDYELCTRHLRGARDISACKQLRRLATERP